jgi:hypothetical protein
VKFRIRIWKNLMPVTTPPSYHLSGFMPLPHSRKSFHLLCKCTVPIFTTILWPGLSPTLLGLSSPLTYSSVSSFKPPFFFFAYRGAPDCFLSLPFTPAAFLHISPLPGRMDWISPLSLNPPFLWPFSTSEVPSPHSQDPDHS